MPFSTERQVALRPSPSAPRIAALALLVLAPLMLGGCSWLGMGSAEEDVLAEIESVAPKPCPTVGVLDGTDKITVFNGQGQDLTDVVVRAEISKAAIQCEYDTDDKTITVDLAFNGLAVMGPAATTNEMSLQGFLAVTRIDGKKVSKQLYDIPIDFGKTRQVRFLKSVDGTVVPYGGDQNGSSYVFLVGFQVSQSQLDYNRKSIVGPLQ